MKLSIRGAGSQDPALISLTRARLVGALRCSRFRDNVHSLMLRAEVQRRQTSLPALKLLGRGQCGAPGIYRTRIRNFLPSLAHMGVVGSTSLLLFGT